jgi:hypothetical protein
MALSDPRKRNPRAVLNKSGGYYPPCFNSSREYSQWVLLLKVSNAGVNLGYCVDCTPDYKMEMMCEGRCSHPETQFIVRRNSLERDELEVIGVSDESYYWTQVSQGAAVIDGANDGKDKQQS